MRKNGSIRNIRKLGGSVFKLFYGPPLPTFPCFVFHNSWRPRSGVLSHGEARFLRHINNVAEHCAPAEPSDLHCSDPLFGIPRDGQDELDYGFVTNIPPVSEEATNQLDHDVSSGLDFPEVPRKQGQQGNGIAAEQSFDPEQRAIFALSASSPARGATKKMTLRGGLDWPASESWVSSAEDAGAIQGTGHFVGPAFAHLPNPHYLAPPRLVSLEMDENKSLKAVFSTPLEPAGAIEGSAAIRLRSGSEIAAKAVTVSGRRVELEFTSDVKEMDVSGLKLPSGIRANDAFGGLQITTWSSIVPLTIV